jgi:dTDP-glucose 4,6-dehydratase
VYDEAKRYAEALTTAYRQSEGVDTAIVRTINTYGPRMRPGDSRAIPTFIRQAPAGDPITVAGDGSQTRSVCSRSAITFIDRPADDPGVRRPEITQAREQLGWEPAVPWSQGLTRRITWCQTHANGHTPTAGTSAGHAGRAAG